MADKKIQEFTADLDIIAKLDDEPNDVGGLSSADLKARFDKAGNLIKSYLNDSLIPDIEGTGPDNPGIIGEDIKKHNEAPDSHADIRDEIAQNKRTADAHIANKENPHGVTAEQIGALKEIPRASASALGGVLAAPATAADTRPVNIKEDGTLATEPAPAVPYVLTLSDYIQSTPAGDSWTADIDSGLTSALNKIRNAVQDYRDGREVQLVEGKKTLQCIGVSGDQPSDRGHWEIQFARNKDGGRNLIYTLALTISLITNPSGTRYVYRGSISSEGYAPTMATKTDIGGVLAAPATAEDTQPVHIKEDGTLATQPSPGSIYATCADEAASPTSQPNTWYVSHDSPRPSGNVGMMVDVFWKNGRTDGIGYDVSLVWGAPGGADNETIVGPIGTSESLSGEYSIPTEGTVRYQLIEQSGRMRWQYVSGKLIPKQFSSATAAATADKAVPGMEIEYLPGMEIYLQMDNGNTAQVMRLVPDAGPTLPAYGNGTGAKTGDIPAGYILHLVNAGDHWQIINQYAAGGDGGPAYIISETEPTAADHDKIWMDPTDDTPLGGGVISDTLIDDKHAFSNKHVNQLLAEKADRFPTVTKEIVIPAEAAGTSSFRIDISDIKANIKGAFRIDTYVAFPYDEATTVYPSVEVVDENLSMYIVTLAYQSGKAASGDNKFYSSTLKSNGCWMSFTSGISEEKLTGPNTRSSVSTTISKSRIIETADMCLLFKIKKVMPGTKILLEVYD